MTTRKTKNLATLGPSSESLAVLCDMIDAGVNVFRLNFSHGDHDYHSKILATIHQAIAKTGKTVGILQDISGPKIRICSLPHPIELLPNDILLGSLIDIPIFTISGVPPVFEYKIGRLHPIP